METAHKIPVVVTAGQYEAAYTFLTKKLSTELPVHLSYHNLRHTQNVIDAAAYLIEKEAVPAEDRYLILTAALYHDSGFLTTYKGHEEASCDIAKESLPSFGYSVEAIEEICRLILITGAPNTAADLYSQVLCDADVYYLGSPNFFRDAENLYKEWKAEGVINTHEEWEAKQLAFLEGHRFFTTTANLEQSAKKKAFLKQVRTQWKARQHKSRLSRQTAETIHDVVYIITGVLVSGFALKGFLVPNHFLDGGISGISLLLHELYGANLALVLALANLPLLVLGYYSVGKRFAVKTAISIFLLSVCLQFIPYPHIISEDKILISVFGGFFIGVGIGLCMRAGSALDGVEVLALKTFKRTPFTVTEIILAINVLIFGIAAFNPKLGLTTALYSILTYFTASKSIDFVVEGIEAYTGVTIISSQSELLKHRLVNELGRGITVYKGERGFLPGQFETSADCDIIFTVVTRLELRRLKNLVHETDPKAFVFANAIREASGGILRRRAAHH